jgi:hypothetical protein
MAKKMAKRKECQNAEEKCKETQIEVNGKVNRWSQKANNRKEGTSVVKGGSYMAVRPMCM